MADISFNDVKQIDLNNTSDNVKGVVYYSPDSSQGIKAWGHPYTFSWNYNSSLETSSSGLAIPSKYFILKPDSIYTCTDTSTSTYSYGYQPHAGYTITRNASTTVYYNDFITYTNSSWDITMLDTCIRNFTVTYFNLTPTTASDGTSGYLVKGNGSVTLNPIVYNDTSFIYCSFPTNDYFSSAAVKYSDYAGNTKSLSMTLSSNNPYFISTKYTASAKYATCLWNCGGDDSSYDYYACVSNASHKYPLWTQIYTETKFPSSLASSSLATPTIASKAGYQGITMMQVPRYSMRTSFLGNLMLNSGSITTSSWSGSTQIYLSFNISLSHFKNSLPSLYSYYKIGVIGCQLDKSYSSHSKGSHDPTVYWTSANAEFGSYVDSSSYTSYSASTLQNTSGTKSITTSLSLVCRSPYECHIIWRAALWGCTSQYGNYELLDVFGGINFADFVQ